MDRDHRLNGLTFPQGGGRSGAQGPPEQTSQDPVSGHQEEGEDPPTTASDLRREAGPPESRGLLCLQLCFALSMIGNPQVVLLDEPSSGMDPKSKQRMW